MEMMYSPIVIGKWERNLFGNMGKENSYLPLNSTLTAHSFLIDAPVLKTTNRWRHERGEPELVIPETNEQSGPS